MDFIYFIRKRDFMITFLCYPKCSTCKKAKAWLDAHHISYIERNIVEDRPSKEEITVWLQKYHYPLKKYFNTSGNVYKSLHLKEALLKMNEEEQIELLSSNGMLVKRPLLILENDILIGFQEERWKDFLEK